MVGVECTSSKLMVVWGKPVGRDLLHRDPQLDGDGVIALPPVAFRKNLEIRLAPTTYA